MRLSKIQLSAEMILISAILILPAIASLGSGNNSARSIYKEFRTLDGAQLQEARAARDDADVKLQKCRELYTRITPEDFAHLMKDPNWLKVKPRPQQEINDFNEVILDYQNIVKKYEGTEIAAYCRHKISAAYQFQGQYDEAINQAQIGSEMFAGTTYETRFYHTIGLIYLQGLHEPENAMGWFHKIPNPGSSGESFVRGQYNQAVSSYISAQQSIIRCQVELGRIKAAVRRVDIISQQFPEHKENVDREFRMQLDIALEKRFKIDNRNRLEYVLKSPEFLADAIAKLDSGNDTAETEPSLEAVPGKGLNRNAETVYTIDGLVREIQSNRTSEKLTEKCKEIIEQLRKEGIESEKALLELYKEDGLAQERTQIINALQALATDKSKETLIEIALNPGMTAHTLGPRAVKALRALTEDSTMISRCLESTNSQIKDAAAQELAGTKLTPVAVSRLSRLLESSSWITHNLVATAFTMDTSSQTAHEKIDIIVNAIPRIASVVSLNKDGSLTEVIWDSREMTVYRYFHTLSGIKDGKSYLESHLKDANGIAGQLITLSLANQGDNKYRDDVLKIINETDDGVIRYIAIYTLAKIGESEDISMLRKLADTNSFERSYISDTEGKKTSFPIREAAENAVRQIEAGKQN